MLVDYAEHLNKTEIIKLGSYYTPQILVDKVHNYIEPYLKNKKNTIIFDSAGGCGAFIIGLKDYNYRIADKDPKACSFISKQFNTQKVYCVNSLEDVNRKKFSIPESSFLIIIGNPPYNDTTSEFKNGEKGINICDNDLKDRDLGMSFLKSYNKLKADIVCILHPLSYLIKESNFKRLKGFKDNYKLIKGEIFSSELFKGTGKIKFPILVALYERDLNGMSFDYIRNFRFSLLNSNKKFILANYETTDGYINKYPPRKNDIQESPINLYYYTFRDINSLKKNTSFITKKHHNGIVVTLENFYKYAYLYSFKKLFNPEDIWLYGNLSPLADVHEIERDKKLYVLYAIKNNSALKEVKYSVIKKITKFYNVENNKREDVSSIENEIKKRLKKLI